MDISRLSGDTYDLTGEAPHRRAALDEGDVVVSRLAAVMRLRDPGLAAHAQRTAEVACAIGADLGLGIESLDRLYTAALLHDIGKLGVPEAILWKPTSLTHGEWALVRTHPEAGHRLVADVVTREVSASILYHHERIDGEGYPFGVSSRGIPVSVRIVQVADAFDAMTSDRPYQGPIPIDVALAEMARCAGTQFDPEITAALARVFEHHRGLRPPIELLHKPPQTMAPPATPPPSPLPGSPSMIRLREQQA